MTHSQAVASLGFSQGRCWLAGQEGLVRDAMLRVDMPSWDQMGCGSRCRARTPFNKMAQKALLGTN